MTENWWLSRCGNNWGWYYQKKLIFEKALEFFQKSINYNKHIKGDEISLSSTHLNIWALFSQQGNHDLAYRHGKMALKLLPAAYRKLKEVYTVKGQLQQSQQYEDERYNLIMTLVVAYYNTGTEWEYLK